MKEETIIRKEEERHNKVIDKINNAKTSRGLPNISYSDIAAFLASNIIINNKKLSQIAYKDVITEMINTGLPVDIRVVNKLIAVIEEELSNNIPLTDEIIEIEIKGEKVNVNNIKKHLIKLLESTKIKNILEEIRLKNNKNDKMTKSFNLLRHESILKQIKEAYAIKDLPKVGLSELNKKLLSAFNSNSENLKFKTIDLKKITDFYLTNNNFTELENLVIEVLKENKYTNIELTKLEILGALIKDETIEYTATEIIAKEERKLFIYINDHIETMENIKNARRISQLPSNLSVSTLTSYLTGNATIYPNDNSLKSENFKKLTELLLKGNRWDAVCVKEELKEIVNNTYPDKEDAYSLLYNKLSKLPRTYYLVEEINFSLKKQKEFVRNSNSNVNVYFIPNSKSPIDGGKFYNCYINRENNLDLSKMLPLNLDEIIPPKMDIDAVEWYIQEKYDETFTLAGGIILKNDETIGNVNIFKPNDGKVGISLEEKEKLDRLSDLDKQIEIKENELNKVKEEESNKLKELDELKKKLENVKSTIEESISDYESRAFDLYKQMLDNAELLKEPLDSKQKIKNQTN